MKALGEARNRHGRILGKMESLGFELQDEVVLSTLTLDVLKSFEIEGESFGKRKSSFSSSEFGSIGS